ncbi:MAG: response regulator [Cyanobacteriota bacterium]
MEIKGKILIVDDDSIVRMILEKHLKKKGFEIVSADSAIKGGQILKADNISLVITDVNMPQVSGIEFLLWIKEFKPKCQVILMTGGDTKTIEAFEKSSGGKVNFFKKPIDTDKLDALIESKFMKSKFKSTITDITIIDFIKMAVLLNKKKLTQVLDPVSNIKGKIYIRDGKIIHAEFDTFQGETALITIASIKKGSFKEIPWEEPKKQSTIHLDTLSLVENMEVLYNDAMSNNLSSHEFETIKRTKILILEDDLTNLTLMNRYFSSRGFQVTVGTSGLEGMQLAGEEFFHLAIVDLNMPGMGGMEFFMWINQTSPRTKVIFMIALGAEHLQEFIKQSNAINYFEKPVDLKALEEFIISLSAEGVSGDFQDIELIDFLQLLGLSGEHKFIRVVEPSTGNEGHIFIMAGSVIHAETEGLEGEEAFYSILGMDTAIFSEEEWYVPPQITMNDSISLLLEHSKKIEHEKTDLNNKITGNSEKDKKEVPTSTSLVRALPDYLEKALYEKKALEAIQNETDMKKKMTIYENGVVLEIILGKSVKSDVISVMKKYTHLAPADTGQMLLFDDITVNVLFNEAGFAEEINFGIGYIGKTSHGVGIGDSLEKAIATYGKPKIGTMKGVVWDNIAFFSQDSKRITSMRMRNKNILEKVPEFVPITQIEQKIEEKKIHEEKPKSVFDIVNEIASLPDSKQEEKNEVKNQDKITNNKKIDRFIIDEKALTALEIRIGKTTRDEVRIKMHDLNYMIGKGKSSISAFYYDDISLKVGFNAKGIVEDLEFGNLYTGKTLKSVGVGDDIKDFIKEYGEQYKKLEGNIYIWHGVWADISVTVNDLNLVSNIKLQK